MICPNGHANASDAKFGAEFFDRAAEHGWHESGAMRRDGEVRTWFGEGGVLQDDHVFTDTRLGNLVRDVWVAEQAATSLRLSLHAPLVVDLEMESIAMTNLGRKSEAADDDVDEAPLLGSEP